MSSLAQMLQVLELMDLAHQLRTILNSHTREILGISLEQTALLYRLAETGGQNMVTALAIESRRTSHTVTAMVDILGRQGLVVRRRNYTADRRQVWVILTALGSTKVQAVQQAGPELIGPLLAGSGDDPIEERLEEALRPLRALLLS